MHQQPLLAPHLPNRSSSAGHRSGVSGTTLSLGISILVMRRPHSLPTGNLRFGAMFVLRQSDQYLRQAIRSALPSKRSLNETTLILSRRATVAIERRLRMPGHVQHAWDLLMMTRSKNCDPAIALPQLNIPSIREAFDLL